MKVNSVHIIMEVVGKIKYIHKRFNHIPRFIRLQRPGIILLNTVHVLSIPQFTTSLIVIQCIQFKQVCIFQTIKEDIDIIVFTRSIR